jgi:uncharacterized protein YjcR
MGHPFKLRRYMAEKTQSKNDTSNMETDYSKGMSISDIAEKYDVSVREVTEAVVRETPETPTITQAEIDEQESKKGK